MKTKKGKPMFVKVLVVIILVFLANIGGFIYFNKSSIDIKAGFTGNSIKTLVSDSNKGMSFPIRVLFIGQWVVLGLLLLFAGYRDRKISSQNVELEDIRINPSRKQTDLDKLYNILKNRKQLRIKNISELFHVEDDVAMEWAKILEGGDLVVIDYPMLGGAVVNYNDERTKNEDSADGENNKSNEEELKGNVKNEIIKGKNIEKKKEYKKNKNLILMLLFIITIGLAVYPFYWLMNNNWDFGIMGANILVFILFVLSALFLFIFFIVLIKSIFGKKKVEIKEIHSNDKQTNKKKDLKIEKKEEVKKKWRKSKGIFILLLFLISLGLGIYPFYWLMNNSWNFKGLIYDIPALVVSVLFVLFVFIFFIAVIKAMFSRRGRKTDIIQKKVNPIIKKEVKSKIKKNIKNDKRKKLKSKKKK